MSDIEPLVFIFKAKVKPCGEFKCPDIINVNYVKGFYSLTQLKVHCKKRVRRYGAKLPDNKLNVNHLPEYVTIIEEGFLTTFKVIV